MKTSTWIWLGTVALGVGIVYCASCLVRSPGGGDMRVGLPMAGDRPTDAWQDKAPIERVSVERYPIIDAPDVVVPRDEFAVQVSLSIHDDLVGSTEVAQGDTTPEGRLRFTLPPGEPWPIDVVLSAPGFVVLQGNAGTRITLSAKDDSTPALFKLRAGKPGQRALWATFWYKGAFLGKARRPITVGATAPRKAPDVRRTREPIVLDPLAQSPDLTIFVLAGRNAADPAEAELILDSSLALPVASKVRIDPGLPDWLEGWYAKFAARGARSVIPDSVDEDRPDPQSTIDLARALGRTLHDRLPPIIGATLSDLDGKLHRAPRVQVYTSTPIIPWELLSYRSTDGAWRDFLGINGAVARWHLDEGGRVLARPPAILYGGAWYAVVPRGSGLAHARDDLMGIPHPLRDRIREVDASRAGLRKALEVSDEVAIVHYAGHGVTRVPDRGAPDYLLRLDDGELTASEWVGFAPARRDHPLFFFNACGLGAQSRVAGMVDGWAAALLEGGASGYIGGLWPLGDISAASFSREFYQAVLRGEPVAMAAARARRAFLNTGDPTYLAYIFYGNLDLRVDLR